VNAQAPQDNGKTEQSAPSRKNVTRSYLAVVAAAVVAWLIYTRTDPGSIIVNADTISVFAPFYIAAQAIERLLEPFASRWNNTTEEKVELKRAQAARKLLDSTPEGEKTPSRDQISAADDKVEAAELALAKAKASRAIPLWAAASSISLLACSMLGLGLIAAVSKEPPQGEFVRTVDVLLTGLAVGAGTKPLHDLISRLEKAKEES